MQRLFVLALLAMVLLLPLEGCGPPCENDCKSGEKICSDKGILECRKDKEGCLAWNVTPCPKGETCQKKGSAVRCVAGASCQKPQHVKRCVGQDVYWFDDCGKKREKAESCPAGTTCKLGKCITDNNCPPLCTLGETRCESANTISYCIKDAKDCPIWSAPTACPAGQSCNGGLCGGSCQDLCTAGEKKCDGAKIQTCARQASGCTDWGASQTCPSGQSCQNNQCQPGCQDLCTAGEKRCDGAKIQTCARQASGCTDWGAPQDCPTGQTCQGKKCQPGCQDVCTAGQKRCDGAKIQTCAKQANGCTAWGASQACPQGESCQNKQCQATCQNACKTGEKRCDGTKIQTCSKQANGCTAWGASQACPQGESCQNKQCQATCQNACKAGEKRCQGTKVESCVKDTKGCLVWQVSQSCPSGQICSGGQCVKPTDPSQRTVKMVCDKWKADYPKKAQVNWQSNGNCDPGTISQGSRDDALRRTNLYRWLVGLPPAVEDANYSRLAQACAIIQANGDPSSAGHRPPTTAKCYNKDGAAASGRSNLSWGMASPADAVTQFMVDRNTSSLGHRLWLISPSLGKTGFGWASGSGRYRTGACQYVMGGGGTKGLDYYAFPSPGPFPIQAMGSGYLAVNDWSFTSTKYRVSSSITVTLIRTGDGDKQILKNTSTQKKITSIGGGYTFPPGISFKPRFPKAGEEYTVKLGTVFSYKVKFVNCP